MVPAGARECLLLALAGLVGSGCAARSGPIATAPSIATPPHGTAVGVTESQPAAPSTAAPSSASATRRSGGVGRTLGWIALSIGAEAAVVAGVTSGMLLHQKHVRDDNCDANRTCTPAGMDANGNIAALVGWNTASFITAVVGVGTGLALVFTHPVESSGDTALTVSPSAGGATVGFRRSF